MTQELFKDKDLILRINFKSVKINNLKKKLINSGWVIDEKETNDGIHVRLYESIEDKEWYNFLYEETDKTADKALKKCLIAIRDYYKKVT